MGLRSLIVKIGADTQSLEKALAGVGESTKTLDAGLKRLGDTPIGKQAQQDAERLQKSLNEITAAYKRSADEGVNVAAGLDKLGGVTKLTSRDLDSLSTSVTRSLDAFRALGQKAPAELTSVAAAIEKQQRALGGVSQSPILNFLGDLKTEIAGTAAGFITAQAAIGAIQGGFRLLSGFVSDSVKAYVDAEDAQTKLIATLKQQKTATPEVIDQYNALATEFQRTTVFSDDLINKMEALLGQVGGVLPSKMRAALDASTNLAAGLGIDLEQATTLVAKAAAGHTETLGKYGVTVSEAALKTKGFDAVLEAINRQFGGQAQAQIETYTGRLEQAKNSWNNFQEAVGKAILTDPIVEAGLRKTAAAANNLDEASQKTGNSWTDLASRASHIIPIFTIFEGLATKAYDAARASNELAKAAERVAQIKSPLVGPQPLSLAAPAASDLPELAKEQLAIAEVTRAAEQLTAEQKRAALAAFAHGQGVSDATKTLEEYWPQIGKSGAALNLLFKQYSDGNEKQKKFLEATKELAILTGNLDKAIGSVDGNVAEAVKFYLKAGASQEQLATAYGLTKTQVKALADQMTVLNRITDLNNAGTSDLADVFKSLGPAFRDIDPRPIGAIYSTVQEIENAVAGVISHVDTLGKHEQALDPIARQVLLDHQQWLSTLDELSSAFGVLAQVGGDAFGGIAKDIGGVIAALSLAQKAADKFAQASTRTVIDPQTGQARIAPDRLGQGVAIAGGVAATAQATGSGSVASRVAGGALSGAVTGAAVGSIVPGIGTAVGFAVGGVAGALVGLFRGLAKPEFKKLAFDVGRDYGVQISEGLAKEMEAASKTFGRQVAGLLSLDKVIAEGGGLTSSNLEAFTGKLHDVFSLLERHQLSAAQATDILDKNFTDFANHSIDKIGILNKQMLDLIQLNDRAGTNSTAVNSFVTGQVKDNALGGLQNFLGVGNTAAAKQADLQQHLIDLQGQLATASGDAQQTIAKEIAKTNDELQKQQKIGAITQVATQGAAQAVAAGILGSFARLQASGEDFVTALQDVTPAANALQEQLTRTGFTGGAAFADLQSYIKIAGDEIAGPALQAVSGLGQAMAGLNNTGLLTQDVFDGLNQQVDSTFEALKAQGVDGDKALRLMQPTLQRIFELQQTFGFKVDDTTQALLTQAEAEGIVGDKFKDPQQRIIDALGHTNDILSAIAVSLGATLPEAARKGAQGVQAELDKIHPPEFHLDFTGGGDTNYAARGGLMTAHGIQYFGSGLGDGVVLPFVPRGRDRQPAMLTPGERVVTPRQWDELTAGTGGTVLNVDVGKLHTAVQALRGDLRRTADDQPKVLARVVRDAVQKVARR
jgi:hypothetical protein